MSVNVVLLILYHLGQGKRLQLPCPTPLPKQNKSSKITLVGNDVLAQASPACPVPPSIHTGVILEQASVHLPRLSGYAQKGKTSRRCSSVIRSSSFRVMKSFPNLQSPILNPQSKIKNPQLPYSFLIRFFQITKLVPAGDTDYLIPNNLIPNP